MTTQPATKTVIGWIFAGIIFTLGILNFIYVDPRPGLIYVIASLVFLPPVNEFVKRRINISIPFAARVIFFVMIIWFTMGVSDLGEVLGL